MVLDSHVASAWAQWDVAFISFETVVVLDQFCINPQFKISY